MIFGLHNLAPAEGARKAAKQVGRGLNSGGAMCGRGNAGQNSRSGPGPCVGFEGGQTPLWKRLPKLGVVKDHSPRLLPVALDCLQHLLLMGRLMIRPSPTDGLGIVVQRDIFKALGESCSQGLQGIKIVGGTAPRLFDHRLCFIAGGFDDLALDRIEGDLNGVAVSVYHDPQAFRMSVRRGHQIYENDQSGIVTPPMEYPSRVWYSKFEERGYLNEKVREAFKQHAPAEYSKFTMVPPMQPFKLPPLPVFS